MAEVIWQPNALNDLIEIVAYIDLFDPGAAVKISYRLQVLGESLADFPNRGRPTSRGCRELTSVPPYVMRYIVIDDVVHIIAVRHGRQRPPAR